VIEVARAVCRILRDFALSRFRDENAQTQGAASESLEDVLARGRLARHGRCEQDARALLAKPMDLPI
jgi:hypothetical protein